MNINQTDFQELIVNNQLVFAGKTASEIINIAGDSPCYIYDRHMISRTIEQVKRLLPNRVHLHYAVKANPMSALVSHIASQVNGLDVASHKELMIALSSGMPANKVSLAGPGKSDKELVAALTAGVVINVESESELARVSVHAKEIGKKANIALRVNPAFHIRGAGMKMTGGAKPFGVDSEKVPKLIQSINREYCHFVGFHIFCGSQILSAELLSDVYQRTISLAVELSNAAKVIPKQINIGGGFGVTYFQHEKPLDIARVCSNLAIYIDKLPPAFTKTEFHLELGRYLVAQAGLYLTKVIDKKVSREKKFLVCDGGMHHHLANSGNFGQVIRKNYPVLIANKVDSKFKEEVNIVGPLCTPLDIIATNINIPSANVGDHIAILMSGAYGATASPQSFLSREQVTELLL
ncbi:pyridoxal-dependent decarboxylase, exosortase A system-associated [Alteromonas naphthalenivorans]|uniref:Orn/DAP/Arg decarboxylase 2 n=1 Tax=Alteromonas naphthalenivorans TaxID=715451 RepID=F5ZFX4_ALTNA|nr:pyridoxal-dependent decarboxylase, exosortase A system-associated [Alteromonas naphthalenivorans]AEF05742.1 Orn/DAP/Arg decarboxylase 2 [Alteromonas naphthalenivorans]